MFDILDPRDDSRDRKRDDDGIGDREDHWLEQARDLEATRDREDSLDRDDRDPDRDRYGLKQRDREPRDRDDGRSSIDPRDVFMRQGEMLALRFADIDDKRQLIVLRRNDEKQEDTCRADLRRCG